MSRWFRHYAGMMRDEKLVRAAMAAKQPVERVVWVWGAILESAAEINDGGRYDLEPAEIAYFLRTTADDIVAILDALLSLERVADGRVAKWGKRQFQSDRSAERQKAHRDRQKVEVDDVVTAADRHGDGEVTAASRHGDAPESESYPKTEKDHLSYGRSERKKANGWSPPRHGATSARHGTVYICKGTDEWTAYAEDHVSACGQPPVPDEHGGKWFKVSGARALEPPRRLLAKPAQDLQKWEAS